MRGLLALVTALAFTSAIVAAFAGGRLIGSAGAANSDLFGDVDCDGAVNAIDALKLLRYTAGLSVSQTQPCPGIGTTPTPASTPTPTPAPSPTPTSTGEATPTPTPTQASGRLIDGLVLSSIGGGLYRSQLVDISDCVSVSILVKEGFLSNTHYSSPDGVEFVAVWLDGTPVRVDVPYTTSSLNDAPVALPFLAVLVDTGAGWQPEAWIWCAF